MKYILLLLPLLAFADGKIKNADISATAGIVDTKLATISTAGKVANTATSADTSNNGSTIVLRDNSGNFDAGAIKAKTSFILEDPSSGSSTVTIAASTVPVASYTLILPPNKCTSGQTWIQDGNGQLSCSTASSSSLSYLATTSSVKTPSTSGDWLNMTNNSITLTGGGSSVWECAGTVDFLNNGGSPAYTDLALNWGTANGADTSSDPASATAIGGNNTIARYNLGSTGGTLSQHTFQAQSILVNGGITIYLNARATGGTIANARVTSYPFCIRIQ